MNNQEVTSSIRSLPRRIFTMSLPKRFALVAAATAGMFGSLMLGLGTEADASTTYFFVKNPGASCVHSQYGYAVDLKIDSPTVYAIDGAPQWVTWWFRTFDAETGQVLSGWTQAEWAIAYPNTPAAFQAYGNYHHLGISELRVQLAVQWFNPRTGQKSGESLATVEHYIEGVLGGGRYSTTDRCHVSAAVSLDGGWATGLNPR